MMTPGWRKAALTAHILASVGWFGAVAAFFVVAVVGLGAAAEEARVVYVSLQLMTWLAIVPLCFASLLTGVVQGLGTPWGLVRHWWVLFKLLLTVLSTLLLLVHTRPIGDMADAATATLLTVDAERPVRLQLAVDAGAALVVLAVNTVLSVVKPKGRTPFLRNA